jgi:hypothetical protein
MSETPTLTYRQMKIIEEVARHRNTERAMIDGLACQKKLTALNRLKYDKVLDIEWDMWTSECVPTGEISTHPVAFVKFVEDIDIDLEWLEA